MIHMVEKQLPPSFHELESFVSWALATERERTARRQSSSFTEIKSFYDAMVTRLQEILDYLDGFALEIFRGGVDGYFCSPCPLRRLPPRLKISANRASSTVMIFPDLFRSTIESRR